MKEIALNILAKVADTAVALNGCPHVPNKGKWQTTSAGCWAGGFSVGLLWLCYRFSEDERFMKWAYKWSRKLEIRRKDRTFDLGFLLYPSFALGF